MTALRCLDLRSLKCCLRRNSESHAGKILTGLRWPVLLEMRSDSLGCHGKVSAKLPMPLVVQTNAGVKEVLAGEDGMS